MSTMSTDTHERIASVIYDTRDLKVHPASVIGGNHSWIKPTDTSPFLVHNDRLREEMEAYGIKRLSSLGAADLFALIESLRDRPHNGTPAPRGLVFHEWKRCKPEPLSYAEAKRLGVTFGFSKKQYEETVATEPSFDPADCPLHETLKHTRVNGVWGHLVPDEREDPSYSEEIREVANAVIYDTGQINAMEAMREAEYRRLVESGLSDAEARGTVWPEEQREQDRADYFTVTVDEEIPAGEAHLRDAEGKTVAIIGLDKDAETRVSLADAGEVKNLADGVKRVAGFEEALRDTTFGHKAIAEMFPFTSETSVRRWRKSEGVVLS